MTRATVRMYRHGLGDCHLVTLHGTDGNAYRILIDCGVILGTPGASAKMTAVMDDIREASRSERFPEGHVDLLVATHEHWDHVSGFVQATASFAKLHVDAVWMAWTENPQDDDAKKLQDDRGNALGMLQSSALKLQEIGASEESLAESLLSFTGMAAGATTKSALEAARNKAPVRYCDPADPPTEIQNVGARVYVLGPPRNTTLLKKVDPSKKDPETYQLALGDFAANVDAVLGEASHGSPFSPLYRLPFEHARQHSFFAPNYFDGPQWRRIDADWLGGADSLALALDSMTNNTSLVLAIELSSKEVLLFAADAQVGNWLSWGTCGWTVDGAPVSGPDVLGNTVLYKVGHHGSINATLKTKGLELMSKLKVAIIPVDHDMAVKKHWGKLPLESLVAALEEAVVDGGCVIRTDEPSPKASGLSWVAIEDLYVEVQL